VIPSRCIPIVDIAIADIALQYPPPTDTRRGVATPAASATNTRGPRDDSSSTTILSTTTLEDSPHNILLLTILVVVWQLQLQVLPILEVHATIPPPRRQYYRRCTSFHYQTSIVDVIIVKAITGMITRCHMPYILFSPPPSLPRRPLVVIFISSHSCPDTQVC
jgi:hypothetical protein